MPNPITKERRETIVQMRRSGASYRDINRSVGAAHCTIKKVLLEAGFSDTEIRRKRRVCVTQAMLRKAFALRREGLPYSEIARRMGVREPTLYYRMREAENENVIEEYYTSMSVQGDDPRSRHCQKISRCGDSRCHLVDRCPAYQAMLAYRSGMNVRADYRCRIRRHGVELVTPPELAGETFRVYEFRGEWYALFRGETFKLKQLKQLTAVEAA